MKTDKYQVEKHRLNGGGGNSIQDLFATYQATPHESLSVRGMKVVRTEDNLSTTTVLFRTQTILEGAVSPDFSQLSFEVWNDTSRDQYYIDSTRFHRYTITTHSEADNIISGVFENYSYCPTTGDTVHIINGRFDVIYFE